MQGEPGIPRILILGNMEIDAPSLVLSHAHMVARGRTAASNVACIVLIHARSVPKRGGTQA